MSFLLVVDPCLHHYSWYAEYFGIVYEDELKSFAERVAACGNCKFVGVRRDK